MNTPEQALPIRTLDDYARARNMPVNSSKAARLVLRHCLTRDEIEEAIKENGPWIPFCWWPSDKELAARRKRRERRLASGKVDPYSMAGAREREMRWVLSDPKEEDRQTFQRWGKIGYDLGYRMARLRELRVLLAFIGSDDKSFGMQELVER